MAPPDELKAAIQTVIRQLMDAVMGRVLVEDPFIEKEHRTKKPLYAALVPDEIFKGSHFERRFVTPFGTAWEKLALQAATASLGTAEKGKAIRGNVKRDRLQRISEILRELEHAEIGKEKRKPDWDSELAYVLEGHGADVEVNVVCDLYVEDTKKTGKKMAFELKAPLPNSDQTKVSKEKLLKLHVMEPPVVSGAFYALPYNPFGAKEKYSWTFPGRWFDMKNDKVVLIGEEFWEIIGGRGTYQTILNAVEEIGREYKDRIYREYLGIEPPRGGNTNKE